MHAGQRFSRIGAERIGSDGFFFFCFCRKDAEWMNGFWLHLCGCGCGGVLVCAYRIPRFLLTLWFGGGIPLPFSLPDYQVKFGGRDEEGEGKYGIGRLGWIC